MTGGTSGAPLLEVRGLEKAFAVRGGRLGRASLRAVDGIDFSIPRGGCLGLVGESGSGKSTVARLVTGLQQPTGGEILFEGRPIGRLEGRARRALGRDIQMVFQDPHASLNPRKTIFASIAEPLVIHRVLRGAALTARVEELLEIVGLGRRYLYRYPHELSGGQKQRVCIARAVALDPKLLVLDEPTSALDVSVQAQMLEFLRGLQRDLGLTYLFISHNLAVVRQLCDEVAVMYLGRLVETGPTAALFDAPRHPYSEVLLASVPLPEPDQPDPPPLEGDIPSPLALPGGCRFHPRCPKVIGPVCAERDPGLVGVGDGRKAACLRCEGT
ncbi:peptide/nickel transport system ATP-binding protein/oligopeptide transport system ATP-binding protein [Tistlia consotensis]|uniref:Peptide/nickel transport system ATP-binding protein/oligopeptide transport system ATP-binding protein n=1 Tax=Tistlia consotensis USBA 355 TaxID=560819 RepID=A0A1Y6CKD2_9PROT|nr:oligopeptide/dipeptide ABC transporter ATP-binding protein [Tistlia consotensis]SMF59480.1 peptide/nickel transport system ATP-binding protein/oligopeptide transport system ATP-binding protein [Tistlia consotensis USBA 355]SNR64391.1 peptide/nickel transport system ATP-binding protein/oligopeptide transport system ATP-binding protein [Tistlia consotensis]